ncbi:Transposon Tf2-11 polyprotein [Frankliniella fusca]|uniref:RNA-directed DNA polymerase n=1 Tax=Frankliniella fusca TaxID=407009 RepID=A0AAE1I3K6_9NEOP|nr:Transposon Tf2-11 polyprotein [Frankliniella fusca]
MATGPDPDGPVPANMLPEQLLGDELDYELTIRGVETVLATRTRKIELMRENKDSPVQPQQLELLSAANEKYYEAFRKISKNLGKICYELEHLYQDCIFPAPFVPMGTSDEDSEEEKRRKEEKKKRRQEEKEREEYERQRREREEREKEKRKHSKGKKKAKKESEKYRKQKTYSSDTSTSSSETSESEEERKPRKSGRVNAVTRWKMSYTPGDDIYAFLLDVEEAMDVNEVSEDEVLRGMSGLLTGSAKVWYRAKKKKFASFKAFKKEFKAAFDSEANDDDIQDKIDRLKQTSDETYIVYEARCEELFDRLSKPLDEETRIKKILKGLDYYYRSNIRRLQIESLRDLRNQCKLLEGDKGQILQLENEKRRKERKKEEKEERRFQNKGTKVAAATVTSEEEVEVAAVAPPVLDLGADKRGYLNVEVLGIKMKGLLDSGSGRTLVGVCGLRVLLAAGLELLPSSYVLLRVANKGQAAIEGEVHVPFNVGGVIRVVTVLYVPALSSACILGLDFWRRYHLRPDFNDMTVEVDAASDNWYNGLVEKVAANPEMYEKFKLQDGNLFKLITVQSNLPLKWVQVLPQDARLAMLKEVHDDPTSGHGGWRRTFFRLRSRAYWPNMIEQVKKYCASCATCQQVKIDRRKPPGFMGTGDVVSRPMELVSADLIGPLPRSSKGYTFLSVITDAFSKYVFIRPLRAATATAVTNHLKEEVILRHGAPRLILVDNGQQYRSQLFQELCKNHHIAIRYNCAYNPRSNPTERTNQTLETMIVSYVQEKHRTWDLFLPELQSALNSSVSHVTGYTPHQVLYGEDLILDGRERVFHGNVEEPVILDPTGESLQSNKEDIYQDIKRKIAQAKQRNAARYNLRRRPHEEFHTGSMVWRKNFIKSDKAKGISKKLAKKWIGPYKVKRRTGRVTYLLESNDGKEDGPWHVDQLKKLIN